MMVKNKFDMNKIKNFKKTAYFDQTIIDLKKYKNNFVSMGYIQYPSV